MKVLIALVERVNAARTVGFERARLNSKCANAQLFQAVILCGVLCWVAVKFAKFPQ
ncbi:MAG: hypothetical protein ACJAR5_003811 [Pseudophaeobacter arcticus]|jgi:hypothetical protein